MWQVSSIYKFKIKDKYLGPLLNLIIVWLFSYSVISAIVSLTILRTTPSYIFIYTGLFTVMSFMVFYNEYTMAVAGSALVAVGLYVNWVFTRETISPEWTRFLTHLHGTWLFITGMGKFSLFYNTTTLNTLICIVTCTSSLLVSMKKSYPIMFILGFGFFITANMLAPEGYHPAFFIMLTVLFTAFVKTSKSDPKAVFRIIPLCLAVVALSWIIPMPQNNFSRKNLEEAYEDIYWFFREPFRPKYFTAGTMGFESADGTLGGNMRANNDFIMYVFADNPIYLTGATKDIYTGTSWQSQYEEHAFLPAGEENLADINAITARTLLDYDYSFVSLAQNYGAVPNLSDYGIAQKRISVNIGKARTGTIFKPPLSYNLEVYGEYNVLQRDMDLRAEPVFKKDAIYSFNYYDIDYDGDFMVQALESSRRGFYSAKAEELIYQLITDYRLPVIQATRYWEISRHYINLQTDYAESVYERYSALPESLPDRVFELAYDLTKDCKSDYEKIIAIQKYLQSFTYTLTPGSVPKDRDFVDYFLFDNQEGYCTYFATSMAVMARAVGLPSRYVEGYLLPETKTTEDYYSVFGTNAHAWAEVYFEGIGWIPIEATPASYFNTYYPTLAENANYDTPQSEIDDGNYEHDSTVSGYGSDDGEEDVAPLTGDGQGTAAITSEVKPVTALIVITVCSAICYMFFRKILEDNRHKAMRSSDYRSAAIESFKGLMDLLAFYGMPMESHESAIAYAQRIGKYLPLGVMTTNTTALVFSKARYSANDISDAEAAVIRQAYFTMYKNLRESNNKYKFFIHRYIKKLH